METTPASPACATSSPSARPAVLTGSCMCVRACVCVKRVEVATETTPLQLVANYFEHAFEDAQKEAERLEKEVELLQAILAAPSGKNTPSGVRLQQEKAVRLLRARLRQSEDQVTSLRHELSETEHDESKVKEQLETHTRLGGACREEDEEGEAAAAAAEEAARSPIAAAPARWSLR
jgi:chromosome segregation ATPase